LDILDPHVGAPSFFVIIFSHKPGLIGRELVFPDRIGRNTVTARSVFRTGRESGDFYIWTTLKNVAYERGYHHLIAQIASVVMPPNSDFFHLHIVYFNAQDDRSLFNITYNQITLR